VEQWLGVRRMLSNKSKKDRGCTYNVTTMRVRAAVVAAEQQ